MLLPTLYKKNKNGSFQQWSVRATDTGFLVTHGKQGGVMQERFTPTKPKNVGKANGTTVSEQAALEAAAKWQKQLDKGYFRTIEEAANTVIRLPMLASNGSVCPHYIHYPNFAQPKLDGVRCLSILEGQNIVLMSRGGKQYPCPPHLEWQLLRVHETIGEPVLDGELYIHGEYLQDIVSAVKKPNELTPRLEFWVFDIPAEGLISSLRIRLLERIHWAKVNHKLTHVKRVDSYRCTDEAMLQDFLATFEGMGYEGVIVRNPGGLYQWGYRSNDLIKLKNMQDSEALVTGVERDKNGSGLLTCLWDFEGTAVLFELKMKGSHEEVTYEKSLDLLGKWVKFKYQATTKDGKPQFAVGLCVRECDSEGNPLE